jgi:aldose 1-epimerase
VTSRLEFWRRPEWMAQFPFAHTVEMTYRLQNGVLEVHTIYENHATEAMPLVIGYHPFFTMPGVPRDGWNIHLPAREHVQLSSTLIPTGDRTPVTQMDLALQGTQLDDVYTDLIRGDDHMARFSVEGGGRSVQVTFGPRYTVAVVYAPKGRDFICFEPMTGITNGANLAHEGKYGQLQSIPAGGKWEESFWVTARGF